MNTEQSIDDILKMLKDSVFSESDAQAEQPKEKKQRSSSGSSKHLLLRVLELEFVRSDHSYEICLE